MKLNIPIALLYLGFAYYSNAQIMKTEVSQNKSFVMVNQEEKFCTLIMPGLESIEISRLIDQKMRSFDGIIMSRCDFNTKRYFAIYNSSTFTQEWFNTFFKTNFNIEIKCYNSGISGVDRPILLTEETCSD